ncbi:hypothetical protein SDRG_05844 [Saprolegnia diclina VS20]|uniref:SWIM-type domain-containing protein n=1 Tax=Saprolegnia diclina (strain VS20) TaxID=1156394 RepID=T0QSQ7_SAPDV|nr:hypothetical protein SDRG_05844 [Saprolegnia diclina VS20]EQC37025.1 hypothetical protein SDRG_05844 [Saprolegnia diclina VS20]|eukprot:XP_008609806.1 hypothetical protein SDRG_05844 [Saprolegnia diclina VS20]
MRSIAGDLGGITTVDELEINFVSKHHVRINADIEVERADAHVIWTPAQVDLVAEKYQCDCKGSFTTGWICSHSVAAQSIMCDLDMQALLAEVAPRRRPGGQRKPQHSTFADGTLNPFYSVANLVALLVDKPGYCYNWTIHREFSFIDTETGRETSDYMLGTIIRLRKGEVYSWMVRFEDAEELWFERSLPQPK